MGDGTLHVKSAISSEILAKRLVVADGFTRTGRMALLRCGAANRYSEPSYRRRCAEGVLVALVSSDNDDDV